MAAHHGCMEVSHANAAGPGWKSKCVFFAGSTARTSARSGTEGSAAGVWLRMDPGAAGRSQVGPALPAVSRR